MNLSRTWRGVLLGMVIALIWQLFGGDVLLWALLLGLLGGLIGFVLDDPDRLRTFAERLER